MDKAYSEHYLFHAQKTLAVYVDYSVNFANIPLEQAMNKFISSGIACLFQQGHPSYTVGCSGLELFAKIHNDNIPIVKYQSFYRSSEYWFGHVLAFYQWYANLTFEHILNAVSADKIISYYNIYHEMDIMQFVGIMDTELASYSHIEKLRSMHGITQTRLAELSSVNVRTIRDYESHPQNLFKAQYNNLSSLSTVLNCSVTDLFYNKNTDIFSENNSKLAHELLRLELDKLTIKYKTSSQKNRQCLINAIKIMDILISCVSKLQLNHLNNQIIVNIDLFQNAWIGYWRNWISETYSTQPDSTLQSAIANSAKQATREAVKKSYPTAGNIFDGFCLLSAPKLEVAYGAMIDAVNVSLSK